MKVEIKKDLKVTKTMVDTTLGLMNLDYFPRLNDLLDGMSYPCTLEELDDFVKGSIDIMSGFMSWTHDDYKAYSQFEAFALIMTYWYTRR